MPTASPNFTVNKTTFADPNVLFDVALGDQPCGTYTIHNRDATNYVRVVVSGLHKGADGGAAIAPGATVPFRCGLNGTTRVVVWAESGTPIIDGFIEAA